MVRVCIVPGCISGSAADLKQRAEENVRKCSLFKAPKDLNQRNKWAAILGIELNDNSKICELHFEYGDLLLDDDLTFVENDWFVYIRNKVNLKKDALPLRDLMTHDNLRKRKAREEEHCNLKKTLLKENERNCVEGEQLKASQQPIHINISSNDDVSMENDSNDNDIIDDKSHVTMEIDTILNEVNVEKHMDIQFLESILEKSQLRQNWAWAKKDDEFFFTFFDLNDFEVRCCLQVHADRKFTILRRDKTKLKNCSGKNIVDSLETLNFIFDYLEKFNLCT